MSYPFCNYKNLANNHNSYRLEGPYLHAYFFMMCTLHQNIPFYVLKTVFYESFYDFFNLKFDTIFNPLKTWKQQDDLHVFKAEKCQS